MPYIDIDDETARAAQLAELEQCLARAVELGLTARANVGIIRVNINEGASTVAHHISMWSEWIEMAEQALAMGATVDEMQQAVEDYYFNPAAAQQTWDQWREPGRLPPPLTYWVEPTYPPPPLPPS